MNACRRCGECGRRIWPWPLGAHAVSWRPFGRPGPVTWWHARCLRPWRAAAAGDP